MNGSTRSSKASSCRQPALCFWETEPPQRVPGLRLREIPSFSARGMRTIYGRADHFPHCPTYVMDIWMAKSGRLFVRFWSRGVYVNWRSYEVKGLTIPVGSLSRVLHDNEHLVPSLVRKKYEEWVTDCIEYPDQK